MSIEISRSYLKAISNVLGNLSAGCFGLAFITPNFTSLLKFESWVILTFDVLAGTIFLYLSAKIESTLEKYE